MSYIFYSVSFFFLIIATALYATRNLWTPHAPPIPYLTSPGPIPSWLFPLLNTLASTPPLSWLTNRTAYVRLPTSFQSDVEAGLSSSTFDLSANIEAGDSRRGLDENGKREVQRIMKREGCGFDEARRRWMEERFGREGIASDGRPLDRKAVMFDRL